MITSSNNLKEKWMTYSELKEYFQYGSTQMASLLKKLTVTKIGKRIFILRESVDKLLMDNLKQPC
jgi:hypothetical protein